jgi:hypothetical protein
MTECLTSCILHAQVYLFLRAGSVLFREEYSTAEHKGKICEEFVHVMKDRQLLDQSLIEQPKDLDFLPDQFVSLDILTKHCRTFVNGQSEVQNIFKDE